MSKGKEPDREEQSYYTLDTSLFTGTFAYFRNEPELVRGKAHTSEEAYSLSKADQKSEPIVATRGKRVYFHLKPYILVPNIRLTVGLYAQPKRYADQEPTIGEVIASSEEPKKKEIEIGQAQAWYYPADKTIVLWECYLYEFVRKKSLADENTIPLIDDPNMKDLRYGLEQFLKTQCIGAKRIATPFNDPIADTIEEYQEFLHTLGYKPDPTAKAAWSKEMTR